MVEATATDSGITKNTFKIFLFILFAQFLSLGIFKYVFYASYEEEEEGGRKREEANEARIML